MRLFRRFMVIAASLAVANPQALSLGWLRAKTFVTSRSGLDRHVNYQLRRSTQEIAVWRKRAFSAVTHL
jgi:hypothetical protein